MFQARQLLEKDAVRIQMVAALGDGSDPPCLDPQLVMALEQHKAAYGQFFSATKGEAEDAEGDTTEAAQAMDEARASTSTHAPLSPLWRMHPAHHALQASAVWCARGTLTRATRAPLPSQAAQFVDLTCE